MKWSIIDKRKSSFGLVILLKSEKEKYCVVRKDDEVSKYVVKKKCGIYPSDDMFSSLEDAICDQYDNLDDAMIDYNQD